MSETFNFEIVLRDSVSAAGRRAASALAEVDRQARKAQATVGGRQSNALGQQFEKVGFAAARAQARQQQAFASSWSRIGMAAERAHKRQGEQAEKAAERAIKATERVRKAEERRAKREADKEKDRSLVSGIKEGLGVGNLTKASFFGALLAESLIGGAKTAVSLLTDGIKRAFEAGAGAENLRLGNRLSLGSSGAAWMDKDTTRFAKLTGFNPGQIQSLMLPLRRAGMSQQESRTAFAASADVAAGKGKGGDLAEVERYMNAFMSLKLRGGIEVEQLAGLGVDVHGFYGSIAKKLGVDEKTAKERMSEGKVDRNLLLNTLYQGIEKQQGGKLGTGAIAYSKTTESRAVKLAMLPDQYLKSISESAAWGALSDRMAKILEALDPNGPRGQKIVGALMRTFERLVGWIDRGFTSDNIERFADATASIVDGLVKIPAILDQVLTVSEIIAAVWIGKGIVGSIMSMAAALPAIATGAGAATAAVGAMAAPLLAVGAAASSVALAINAVSKTAGELGGWDAVKQDFKDWVKGDKPAIASDAVNANSPQWKKDKARSVKVDAPMVVHINGVDASTGRKVGDEAHRHMISAHERAAQEGG